MDYPNMLRAAYSLSRAQGYGKDPRGCRDHCEGPMKGLELVLGTEAHASQEAARGHTEAHGQAVCGLY